MQIKDWGVRKLRSQQKADGPLGDFQEAKSQAQESKEDVTSATCFYCSLSPGCHWTLSDSETESGRRRDAEVPWQTGASVFLSHTTLKRKPMAAAEEAHPWTSTMLL
ncbi:hypothetical protein STEG23_025361 [Scotinomys teguina]